MTGIELIAKERQEQIKKHNRTIAKDVTENSKMQLRQGAVALICKSDGVGTSCAFSTEWDKNICLKMLHKSYKDRLIIAGALIAAEIDRLQHIDN